MSRDRLAFERIAVRRAPGFEDRGFELTDLSPGVNLVHGPQAVGKSTTGRAIAWLLWPEQRGWQRHSVAARLRIGDERWLADADHAPPRLEREGREASHLPTPGRELADRYSLALHDLLQAETDDAGFARLINRELAGGFDLDAALEEVGAQERPGRPQKKIAALRDAEQRVAEAEREQSHLAESERSLDRLRREEAEARRAGRELAEVQAILAWRRHRDALERESRVLEASFPEAMERLTGDEAERLADLDGRIEEAQRRIADLRRKIERAEARLEEADLPEGGVPTETLTALAEERRRAEKLESAVAERRSALEGARSRRDDARARLGDAADAETLRGLGSGGLGSGGADDWEPLLDLARRGERLRGRRAQVDDVESWIGRVEPPVRTDNLAAAVGRLRRWLASPAAPLRVGVPGLAAALLFTALAVVLALAGPAQPDALVPGALLWIAAAVGAGLAVWIGVGLQRGAAGRRAAEREYQGIGLEPPTRWAPAAVEERLRALESRLVETGVETEKSARWADLEGKRKRLERETAELEAEREELIERLGIAPALSTTSDDAPLAALVRDLCAFRAADEACREQEAVLAARIRERDDVLSSAGARLVAYGYPPFEPGREGEPGSEPGRVELLAGRIDELRGREEARAAAREALDEAAGPDGALAREEAAAERLRAERRELFERLDLEEGDRGELTRLLDLHPGYQEQAERVRKARYDLERSRADLPEEEGEGEGGVRDLPEEDLEARRADLERRAGRLEDLVTRIGVIEDRVARAKESHNLEDALAARDDALAALREERERDADALVAHELGAWLREQMRGRRRPSVMKRAAELFARITAGRFELLDPEGDPPELRARDTASGRGRSLGELSGGIRLQLLLAVRMAFIEDQEGSVRLPLVMDETLANSDDRTARAIIEAVLELARDGRQVFYLTAQQDEVAKWRAALEESAGEGTGEGTGAAAAGATGDGGGAGQTEAEGQADGSGRAGRESSEEPKDAPRWKVIDLAAVRRQEETEALPRSVWHPQEERVPAPEGRTREEYADLLDVPGLDPHQGVHAVHLWYLVEETETLHGLVKSRMLRWGQIQSLGEGVVPLLGGGEQGETRRKRIEARAHCLNALFEAWREGRGRPVGKQELLESGAVSARFLDEVTDLCERVEGDAAALIQALRNREVPGFRTDKIEDLEAHLEEQGHLDPRERLTREQLRTRALQSLQADLEAGHITPTEVENLLQALPGLNGEPPSD